MEAGNVLKGKSIADEEAGGFSDAMRSFKHS
jgi:hypothetical protein